MLLLLVLLEHSMWRWWLALHRMTDHCRRMSIHCRGRETKCARGSNLGRVLVIETHAMLTHHGQVGRG